MRIGPFGRRALAVLALVVVAGLTLDALVDAYQRGYDAELGSRAGAEPVAAGVYVALPWVGLLAAELLALVVLALWRMSVSRPPRP